MSSNTSISSEPGTHPPAETFGRLLGEISRAWRTRLDERLKPLGLSQAKWLALLQLHRCAEAMTQKQLAKELGIEGATLTTLLDRLVRDDYVQRREGKLDRRCKTVHLTPRAMRVIKQITAVAAELRQELLDGISVSDMRTCIRTLRRVQQSLDRHHEKPRRIGTQP